MMPGELSPEEMAKYREESRKKRQIFESLREDIISGLEALVSSTRQTMEPEKKALILREAAVAFAALEKSNAECIEIRRRTR